MTAAVALRDPRDVEAAWRLGELSWKLDANQESIYQQIHSCGRKRFVLNCSRRIGKSFLMVLIAIEAGLKHRKWKIKFAASTADDLEEIILPLFEEILTDCPEDLKPKWKAQKQKYVFPSTGSEIKLSGCDNRLKANRLRGTAANLVIIEEAGSIPELTYVVRSVLAPQLISTGGMMLFASTPPDSPGHEFVSIAETARRTGAYAHRTIFDCPRYSKEQVDEFIREEAGDMPVEEYLQTEDFRREFLAEFLTDPTRAVLKYATQDVLKRCVELYLKLQRPSHFVAYEGMDVGWSPDWTAVLFGYWHHLERVLVIEREIILRRMSTDELATKVKAVEVELFGPTRQTPQGHGAKEPRRWSDYDARLLFELADKSGLVFSPTAKDDRDTAIDNLNRMLPGYNDRLAISETGCPVLLEQMRDAIWNKGRTDFARTKKHGHFDALAGLIYLSRNIVRDENPVPAGFGIDPRTQFVVGVHSDESGNVGALRKLFGLRGRK